MSGSVALTPAQFRTDFRSFADKDKYTDQTVQLYLNLAFASLSPTAWGQFYVQGMELFAAHHLVIDARDQQVEVTGGTAGNATGRVSSKGVGGASVGWDSGSTAERDAGWWNLTTFGTRYFRLVRLVGMGGAQLGGNPGAIAEGVQSNSGGPPAGGWPGPFTSQIPNA